MDEFVIDIRTQWAVEMGLIRIGEAVNRIPVEVLGRFPDQPWRQIVAMRSNFDFIKTEWPGIYADCVRAESYLSSDPAAACFYAPRCSAGP